MKALKVIGPILLAAGLLLFLCLRLINEGHGGVVAETGHSAALPSYVDISPQGETEYRMPDDYLYAVYGDDMPNGELQIYTLSQALIDGSCITLTADRQGNHYVSGKVESKVAFRYGSFSFRINTVTGTSFFPAIWLLPADGREYPEIDIYELIGSEPHLIYGVLHYWENDVKKREFFKHAFSKKDIPESYEIRFEWSPGEMVWHLDGQRLYTVKEHVPDDFMYLIINLAVGGTWPGAPDESTSFPTAFRVEVLEFEPVQIADRQSEAIWK